MVLTCRANLWANFLTGTHDWYAMLNHYVARRQERAENLQSQSGVRGTCMMRCQDGGMGVLRSWAAPRPPLIFDCAR